MYVCMYVCFASTRPTVLKTYTHKALCVFVFSLRKAGRAGERRKEGRKESKAYEPWPTTRLALSHSHSHSQQHLLQVANRSGNVLWHRNALGLERGPDQSSVVVDLKWHWQCCDVKLLFSSLPFPSLSPDVPSSSLPQRLPWTRRSRGECFRPTTSP